MKNLNVMLLAVVMVMSSFVNANTTPKETSNDNLTNEIKELLKKPSMSINQEQMAEVTFTLNKNKEIVVLSVESASKSVENYIKQRLNYQKVEAKVQKGVKFYKIPVKVIQK